uniref:Uncharacterized protein n=1 Tax=Oryza punctata TaxID=4537 RepID=A0A0E0L7B7_ORYPU
MPEIDLYRETNPDADDDARNGQDGLAVDTRTPASSTPCLMNRQGNEPTKQDINTRHGDSEFQRQQQQQTDNFIPVDEPRDVACKLVLCQLLKLLELGDGEGDVSIQQVARQIPAWQESKEPN